TLVEKNKHKLLETVQKISGLAKFSYVRQPVPMGDGHAILCAKHLVNEGEAVAVLFGDDLVDSEVPAIKQLLSVYERYGDSVVALSKVDPEEVSKFGVVGTTELGNGTHEITQFVEKPKKEDAPSNLVSIGKYIITWDMLETLETLQEKSSDGEVRLADAFIKHIANDKPLYGHEIEGERHDCGDKFGFVKATIALGLKHPEVGTKLKEYLKNLKI
ncbi:MAG: sugar phosphate nucleotidyltransferase, partial [Patescibacteria group bacterium]